MNWYRVMTSARVLAAAVALAAAVLLETTGIEIPQEELVRLLLVLFGSGTIGYVAKEHRREGDGA